jgi:hypothetical protein
MTSYELFPTDIMKCSWKCSTSLNISIREHIRSNTAATERTNAPPIDRTNRPKNRGITGAAAETHVYAPGNDSNTPFKEEDNLIDEFQSKYIIA